MGLVQRLFFWLAYRFGRAPWDTGVSPPELTALVEGAGALPPGRALDLGCGTGTNCVYLAGHGWQVVGVDLARRAVGLARAKAARAGVPVQVIQGDVTRLPALHLEPGFALVLDLGCFHALPAGRRDDYARGVAALVGPGASYLLFCFRRPGGLPPGVPDAEVRRALEPHFEVAQVQPGEGDLDPAWYLMRPRSSTI
ncbi:MAG: class I SAM-dependent methyltransferase [Candidatus Dormibacteraceae bacterium]